jgi:hypothetical protein
MSIEEVEVLPTQDAEVDEDVEQTGTSIWNYYKIDGVQSKRGGAKNITCTFCDTTFTGCSSTRAFGHILGRAVLGQKRSNVGTCVPKRQFDDNRYAHFKIAQKVLNTEMMAKERQLSSSQAKQTFLDLTSPGKRTVTGEMKIVESKMLDSTSSTKMRKRLLTAYLHSARCAATLHRRQ